YRGIAGCERDHLLEVLAELDVPGVQRVGTIEDYPADAAVLLPVDRLVAHACSRRSTFAAPTVSWAHVDRLGRLAGARRLPDRGEGRDGLHRPLSRGAGSPSGRRDPG